MLLASLLVLAAALPADDLPPLAETLPAEAVEEAPAPDRDPVVPPIVQPATGRQPARVAEARVRRNPDHVPTEYPLSNLPFIQGGFGQLSLQLTGLDGSFLLMRNITLDVRHRAFSFGATLLLGATDPLSFTAGGLNAHWQFATYELLDFTAGMTMAIGGATRTADGRSTALFVWQPEAGVHARLASWLRASASMGWRLVNAGSWAGPTGDKLSGFALSVGLGFGSFESPAMP